MKRLTVILFFILLSFSSFGTYAQTSLDIQYTHFRYDLRINGETYTLKTIDEEEKETIKKGTLSSKDIQFIKDLFFSAKVMTWNDQTIGVLEPGVNEVIIKGESEEKKLHIHIFDSSQFAIPNELIAMGINLERFFASKP